MSNLFSNFLNKFAPAQCLLCSALLREDNPRFCQGCINQLPRWHLATSCPQCGQYSYAGLLCGRCLKRPPAFDRSYAAWIYTEPIQSLIQAAKFGHQWSIFQVLATELCTQMSAIKADLIIPIPLHPNRLAERGYNQAEEISKIVAQTWQLPCQSTQLKRIKDTEHQARLSRKARWKNLRDAFSCNADYHGKTILLIDDVMTSGASLNMAAAALKKAGAHTVINLVLARTPAAGFN